MEADLLLSENLTCWSVNKLTRRLVSRRLGRTVGWLFAGMASQPDMWVFYSEPDMPISADTLSDIVALQRQLDAGSQLAVVAPNAKAKRRAVGPSV